MSWRHILQLLLSHPVIKKMKNSMISGISHTGVIKPKLHNRNKQAKHWKKDLFIHANTAIPINNNNNYNSSSDNNYVRYFTLDFPWGNSPCPLFPGKTGILVFLVEGKPVDPKINLWSTGKNWWQTQPRPEGCKASTLITAWGELRYW